MTSIRSKMASGAAWMVLFKTLDRSLGLVSTVILARVLVPADFGLVAMATSLIAILELFSAFGVDVALIQRPNAVREHFDTAWTLNGLAGVTVACAMLVFAWPLSWFYNEPRLVAMVCVLAIGSVLQGWENIGVVAFRKEMNFQREFRYLMIKRFIAFCIGVTLALVLRNYWALVISMIAGRAVGVTLSYYLHPYRPKLSLAAATEFLHFSKWLVVQNMLFFLRERAPDFILGKVSGPHAVGIMNVSTEIASMPGTELIAPINRAALPGYSKLRDDPAALRREYLAVASLVTLVVTPVVAGIGVVASIVVALLLGPKWHEAAIIINLMAFLGITNVFLGTAHAPLLAMGRPSVFAKITAIQVSVLIPVLIIMSSRYGVVGAATGYILTALGLLPLNIALVLRTIEMRAATLLREVWRPILAAGTMYVVTKLVAMPVIDIATLSSSEALRLLAIYVPLGALVYVATLASLWMLSGRPEGAETIVMRIVAERLRHVHALLSRQ